MKKGTDLELVIFFFAILFLPKIGMLDLKMIAVAVFLGISLTRDRKIGIDGRLLFSVGIILSLIFMFLIKNLAITPIIVPVNAPITSIIGE